MSCIGSQDLNRLVLLIYNVFILTLLGSYIYRKNEINNSNVISAPIDIILHCLVTETVIQ